MTIRKPEASGVTVKIVHADMMRFLDACSASGIAMKHVVMEDEMTAVITVERRNQKQLAFLCHKHNADIVKTDRRGICWRIYFGLKRPILIAGVTVMLLLSASLPRYALIFRVSGNETIPDRQILEAAESAGIYFGASRKQIRSEQVKNQLLEKLPQLQWVGVNTSGCVATISVKERSVA